ncbi:putative F-box protein At1g52490 [Papaver somniferum]|uniref:putative F-box protein At1g52490 n=1 Tax=Papaver somniferum TaxID=3469 RepID=UPI000E700DF6|nr:putative F-box protein At1g52490 [Papaver somniferum]
MEKKFPSDIMLDIVSPLRHETIIHCKLVCKPWRDILNNIKVGVLFRFGKPAFNFCYRGEQYDDIDMHENYSYTTLVEIDKHRPVELEPLSDMVGSCNGLVCFSVRRKFTVAYDPIYICNPVTEEYVYLPTFNYDEPYDDLRVAGSFDCGFGYHRFMDEYKVVRIHGALRDFSKRSQSRKVEVYTLGSGHGWRDKGSIDHLLVWDHGVCANGAIHWVEYRKNKIVAFDCSK